MSLVNILSYSVIYYTEGREEEAGRVGERSDYKEKHTNIFSLRFSETRMTRGSILNFEMID